MKGPGTRNGHRGHLDPHLVSLLDRKSFEAEHYRMLRHSVERKRADTGIGVIAVTSPGAGDGKTTTVINLGGALAQSPKARVLLVEADLRRPSMASRFGGRPERPGLLQVVTAERIHLEDAVHAVARFNLSVTPAGGVADAPYEILSSPRLRSFIDAMRRRFDFILVDTPPVVSCPDYRIVETSADAALLVVGAHRTPRKMFEEALSLVDPKKTLGVVLNGDDGAVARFQRKYYEREQKR